MSYLALARKWRPRTFSQLVGQEHINKALMNSLDQQRLHHAYLFTGTRGVGKTSVARILAKALNCEKGISSEPCLQCDACLAIEQGRFIDLIEIDGASKTRVEDTRELLDNVQYAPTSGRFKIYLIDEVHMLSQHSFNALLKTLEEPPSHVKFILATTDPQKLPVTVLSRCLQFNLRNLPQELISKQLQLILNEEQLDSEEQALNILAHAARGSMRDALSLLDQAITSCDKYLRAADVKSILGYTQQDYAIQLLQALADNNAPALLILSQKINAEGGHFQYVLDELLNYLHEITVYKSVGNDNPLIQSPEDVKLIANYFCGEDIQLFYQIALKACEEIHLAPSLAIGFNMAMLRMLMFRPLTEGVTPPLTTLQENKTKAPIVNEPPPEEPVVKSLAAIDPTPVVSSVSSQCESTAPSIEIKESENEPQSWSNIISKLKLTGLARNAIENAEFIEKSGREISLRVAKGHQSLFTPATLTKIEEALANYYQSPVKIILKAEESIQASPAQQKERATQQKQKNAETALSNDPLFQQLQQEFSAELVKNSIVSLKDDI